MKKFLFSPSILIFLSGVLFGQTNMHINGIDNRRDAKFQKQLSRIRDRRQHRLATREHGPNMLITTSKGRNVNDKQLAIIERILTEDFLVNDDITGGTDQWDPGIAMDNFGNFVIVWEDKRNGYCNSDIYFQYYNASGVAQGANQKVNDDNGASYQGWPGMGMNDSGHFVIAWWDFRNGPGGDVYFQRFDASGIALGVNQKVNNMDGIACMEWFGEISIGMNEDGEFVIAWNDIRNGRPDIYFQRYNFSGIPQGNNHKVNDDLGNADQWDPEIFMDRSGNFILAWDDERNGQYNMDIYFQRFDASGLALGSNKRVNDDPQVTNQYDASIAMDENGNFIIAWEDPRNFNWDIYFQRYDNMGGPVGGNQRIDVGDGGSDQLDPQIAMDDSGNFVIAWHDARNGDWDIYFQRFDNSCVATGNNQRVDTGANGIDQWGIAMAMEGMGNFIFTWEDLRNVHWDIYFQRYTSLGGLSGANQKVNDDIASGDQYHPSIAQDDAGNFVITWEDNRSSHWDTYFQRYDASGSAQGPNRRVNDDTGSEEQWDPCVAMDASGNFVITWEDERNGNYDIYFQRYDASGMAQGNNRKVNDDAGTADQLEPSIAMDDSGRFMISWSDERDGNWNVYLQWYSASGVPQWSNQKVNEAMGDFAFQGISSSVMNKSGNSVIAWWDWRRGGNGDIYFQRYDASGLPQGSNQRADDEAGVAYYEWLGYPSIAMEDDGNFVIAWQDNRNGNLDIYYQRYDAQGVPEGANQRAHDDAGLTDQYNPWIAMDGSGHFVIAWENWEYGRLYGWNDWLNGQPDIVGQRFYSDGSKRGETMLIVADGLHHGELFPTAVANKDRIVFSWEDNRRSKGSDIYAKIVPWDWEGITSTGNDGISTPYEFALYQNTPNPFNPQTFIRFSVREKCRVVLTIYDILGREIMTLVDKKHGPGVYQVAFVNHDLPSGLYFYRIRMQDFVNVKKMVLLE